MKSDHLVAHVAENSPAQEAGIRNGDVLRRIADFDVTKWRTDPRVFPLSRFWSRPAGTELELTLARDNNPIKVKVELKELFPQVSSEKSESSKPQHSQAIAPANADELIARASQVHQRCRDHVADAGAVLLVTDKMNLLTLKLNT